MAAAEKAAAVMVVAVWEHAREGEGAAMVAVAPVMAVAAAAMGRGLCDTCYIRRRS